MARTDRTEINNRMDRRTEERTEWAEKSEKIEQRERTERTFTTTRTERKRHIGQKKLIGQIKQKPLTNREIEGQKEQNKRTDRGEG